MPRDSKSKLDRYILAFFRRTRGLTSLEQIQEEATRLYPALDPAQATEQYYRMAVKLERREQQTADNWISEAEQLELDRFERLQFDDVLKHPERYPGVVVETEEIPMAEFEELLKRNLEEYRLEHELLK